MRESELHNHLYTLTRGMSARWPQVVLGPGDDCAAVTMPGGGAGRLIVTVDQLVEGRHFTPATSIDLIARKAVARSVSDIAAMGGSTTGGWGLATGLLPADFAHARELTESLHKWAAHWGFPIVGGDIATGAADTLLALTVTIAGPPHPKRGPVLRSGAKPGDDLWVTGRIGNSFASGRHLTFEPRLAPGAWLCDTLGEHLHAMIDISDGLGRDASRIAAASNARIELDGALVPLHADVTDRVRAIGDGEDYELCFSTSPNAPLPPQTPDGVKLTRIGRVVAGSGCTVTINGAPRDAAEMGWDHT